MPFPYPFIPCRDQALIFKFKSAFIGYWDHAQNRSPLHGAFSIFFHEIYQIYHVFLREFFQSPIQSQNTNKNSNFFIKHFFLQNLTLFVCLGKVCLPEAGPCSRRTSKAGALPYQDKTYWFSWQSNERVLRLEEKTLNYFFFSNNQNCPAEIKFLIPISLQPNILNYKFCWIT